MKMKKLLVSLILFYTVSCNKVEKDEFSQVK